MPAAIAMTTFSKLTKCVASVLVAAICIALPAQSAWHAHPARLPARSNAMLPPGMGDESPLVINISSGRTIAQIVVPENKSRIIHFSQSFSRVHVGSGDIAEIVPLSGSSIYVLGKKRGSTNLTLTNGSNGVVAVVDVTVTYDVDGLRQQLAEILPTESIEIHPAGDALVLSGHVTSADHLRTIVSLAERFAPGAVTNLLSLYGSQQVLLEVKFAEVQRSALLNMGLNSLNGAASNHGVVPPSASPSPTANSFATIGGLLTDSKTYFLSGQINALEQSGLVRTLAEPNVVAMSGETATFLAGGEIPIPVVQASTGSVPTTSIVYKDFGVGLSFTPTVISDDTVNLVLKSEVSAIDPSVSVSTSGISVPGFKVRRSTTTVELRNGQSFAIAGLIQNDFSDTLNAIPGIGSIPIIGALLRSTNYQRNQTELVVFITVHLVGPGPASNISLPTDRVVPPTAGQILGLGHTEETRVPPPPAPGPGSMNGTPAPVADNAPAPMVAVESTPSAVASPPPKVAELPPPAKVGAPASPVVVAASPPVIKVEAPPPVAAAVTPPAAAAASATPSAAPTPAPAETPAAPTKVAELPAPAAEAMTAPPPVAPVASATPSVTAATSETRPTKVADLTPAPAAELVTAPPTAARTPVANQPAAASTTVASLPPAPATDGASAAVTTPAAAPVAPTPVAKPVTMKPVTKKVRVAVTKPARIASTKPAHKPAPVAALDDLPVTAPANVEAPESAVQPDSNGGSVP